MFFQILVLPAPLTNTLQPARALRLRAAKLSHSSSPMSEPASLKIQASRDSPLLPHAPACHDQISPPLHLLVPPALVLSTPHPTSWSASHFRSASSPPRLLRATTAPLMAAAHQEHNLSASATKRDLALAPVFLNTEVLDSVLSRALSTYCQVSSPNAPGAPHRPWPALHSSHFLPASPRGTTCFLFLSDAARSALGVLLGKRLPSPTDLLFKGFPKETGRSDARWGK